MRPIGPLLLTAFTLLGATAAGCVRDEERQVSVTFHVWCQVVTPGGTPVDGQLVTFAAIKVGYDGAIDPSSPVDLGEATMSGDPAHPGSATFELGYTLHQLGDDQEYAALACTTIVPGADNDVHVGFEYTFEQARAAPTMVERTLILRLP
ncbi:MAG: hypothetical protein IPL61_33505 [Myxococcales bacterium]|nr:hypothetical protein [Myxococcales bacterium]